MELGTFSISLAVKDLQASKAFYEKFGFTVFHGDASQNWLIMKNGDHLVYIYSEQLYAAQEGLIQALKYDRSRGNTTTRTIGQIDLDIGPREATAAGIDRRADRGH